MSTPSATWATLLLGLLGLGFMAASVAVIEHGEVAVVFRLGVPDRTLSPGIQAHLPWPIETLQRVGVGEVRRTETGQRRMLTGDTNLVNMSLAVQYTVSEPLAYSLGLLEPEKTVTAEASRAATRVVSTLGVDTLLTTGRADLESAVMESAQLTLDRMHAGIHLVAVDVTEVSPPPAVVDAFNDVSSARGDADTLSLSAQTYASRVLPETRGRAAQAVEGARAHGTEALARAAGDIARFEHLRAAAAEGPEATRRELQRTTLEQISQTAHLIVAAPGTQIVIDTRAGTEVGP